MWNVRYINTHSFIHSFIHSYENIANNVVFALVAGNQLEIRTVFWLYCSCTLPFKDSNKHIRIGVCEITLQNDNHRHFWTVLFQQKTFNNRICTRTHSLRANEGYIGVNEYIDHKETNLDTSEWVFSVDEQQKV